MNFAFANFNEPHAWLIRGLVEYGWRDVTRMGGVIPPGAPGGLNLGHLLDTQGREAMLLLMAPEADGRQAPDPIYEFEVYVTGSHPNIKVVLRCADVNFLEEYPYDLANPSWAAGYVHQALTAYVPEFVRWRLGGNELSWSQRTGVPEVEGDTCSADLARFVRDRLARPGLSFDTGPAEGWWSGISAQTKNPWGAGPLAAVGKGGGDPVYISAKGRADMNTSELNVERVVALDMVEGPATWLNIMAWIGIFMGGLGVVNAVITLIWYKAQFVAMVTSVLFALVYIGGGLVAQKGITKYRQVRASPLIYAPMVYCAVVPLCCLVGMPLAIWSLLVWLKPEVQAGRV